jgi:hypothetical protein
VLRIFFALKIRRLPPGVNQRTWVPKASTIPTRPPKPLLDHIHDVPQSVGLIWTSDSARRRDHYLTTHNTHNRQTSMPPGGIRTCNPSRRAAADLRHRPRGHWDRHCPRCGPKFRNQQISSAVSVRMRVHSAHIGTLWKQSAEGSG